MFTFCSPPERLFSAGSLRLACRKLAARIQFKVIPRRRPNDPIPPGQLHRFAGLHIIAPEEIHHPLQMDSADISTPAHLMKVVPDDPQGETVRQFTPTFFRPDESFQTGLVTLPGHALTDLLDHTADPDLFLLHRIGQSAHCPE